MAVQHMYSELFIFLNLLNASVALILKPLAATLASNGLIIKPASEAVAQSCSVKKVFLEISKIHRKKETLAQVFPVNFAKFLRAPPVAASAASE